MISDIVATFFISPNQLVTDTIMVYNVRMLSIFLPLVFALAQAVGILTGAEPISLEPGAAFSWWTFDGDLSHVSGNLKAPARDNNGNVDVLFTWRGPGGGQVADLSSFSSFVLSLNIPQATYDNLDAHYVVSFIDSSLRQSVVIASTSGLNAGLNNIAVAKVKPIDWSHIIQFRVRIYLVDYHPEQFIIIDDLQGVP